MLKKLCQSFLKQDGEREREKQERLLQLTAAIEGVLVIKKEKKQLLFNKYM